MKPRAIWVILFASIGFNVFCAVGYFSVQRKVTRLEVDIAGARKKVSDLQTFSGRARLFAAQLKLDSSQMAVFDQMLKITMDQRAQARTERLPAYDQMLVELQKDQPDPVVLKEYAQRDDFKDYRWATVEMMKDFAAALRPEQKKLFFEALRKQAQSND